MTAGAFLRSVPVPCVRGCVRAGFHLPACGADACGCACHADAFTPCNVPGGCAHVDPACPGCEPARAVPGGCVCLTCWEETTAGLARLVDLYEDLLTPTRVAFGVGRVSGTAERALVLDDGPRWSREWIRAMLLHWRIVLAPPREPTKAERDAHRHAVKTWDGQTPIEALPEPPYGRGLGTPASSDPHETIRAVSRHAEWLLAQPEHADQFVYDVAACIADATRTAYPSAPRGVFLGLCPLPYDSGLAGDGNVCGAPLRYSGDRPLLDCRKCGHSATPYEWRRLMLVAENRDRAAEPDAVATGKALAAWLTAAYGRPFRPDTVRQWASAGTQYGRLPRVGRDPQGRTLYPLVEGLALAEALYGPPPPPAAPAVVPAPAGPPPPEETPDDAPAPAVGDDPEPAAADPVAGPVPRPDDAAVARP